MPTQAQPLVTLNIGRDWPFSSRVNYYAIGIRNWPQWDIKFMHEGRGAFTIEQGVLPLTYGQTWTKNEKIAEAIDRSCAINGGMVVLNTTDAEEHNYFATEFAGICSVSDTGFAGQGKDGMGCVYEYFGVDQDDPLKTWAIQLCYVVQS